MRKHMIQLGVADSRLERKKNSQICRFLLCPRERLGPAGYEGKSMLSTDSGTKPMVNEALQHSDINLI